jgi:Flp pilus assembly protein CpaB
MPSFSWSTGRWPRLRGRPALLIRRVLAAILLLAAGVLAVKPGVAKSDSASPAIISARDIAAGTVLRPADIHIVSLPDAVRPVGTLSTIESAAGRLLAGAARSGEPITDARLVGTSAAIPSSGDLGKSIVPVRLADTGIATLLHPGERVDVVTAPESDGHQRPADMAVVITVVAPEAESGRGATRKDGSLVLLELSSDRAAQVAAMSLERPVTVTLR